MTTAWFVSGIKSRLHLSELQLLPKNTKNHSRVGEAFRNPFNRFKTIDSGLKNHNQFSPTFKRQYGFNLHISMSASKSCRVFLSSQVGSLWGPCRERKLIILLLNIKQMG